MPRKFGVFSILTNAFHLVGARAVKITTRFVYMVAVARFLGSESYGLLGYAHAWYILFLPIAMFGLNVVIPREIGRDRQHAPEVIGTSIYLNLTTSTLCALACLVFGLMLEPSGDARTLMIIVTVALFGRVMAGFPQCLFLAYEVSQETLRQESIFRSLEVIIAILLLLAGFGLLAVAMLHALVWWAQAFAGLRRVNRAYIPIKPMFQAPMAMRLFKLCLPVGISTGLIVWLHQLPLIIARHSDFATSELGQIVLTFQLLGAVSIVPQALALASMPVLSRASARADGKDLVFVEIIAPAGLLAGALILVFGDVVGPPVVLLIFGAEYRLAGEYVGPVLALVGFAFVGFATRHLLISRGTMSVPVVAGLIGISALLLLWYVTEPFHSLGSLIGCTAAGLVAWNVVMLAALVKADGPGFLKLTGVSVIAAAISTAAYYLLRESHQAVALTVSVIVLFGGAIPIVLRMQNLWQPLSVRR